MQPEERAEVEELLEHQEETAGGRMTTDYIALAPEASVADAGGEAEKLSEGGIETVSTIYLLDPEEKLMGAVPLHKLVLSSPETHRGCRCQTSRLSLSMPALMKKGGRRRPSTNTTCSLCPFSMKKEK